VGWLAPLFLALGVMALAIPVLVHLIHRERADTIAFPSLMFLQRIPYRSMRRQKIRNWLLFVLRCAALVLLASAFARPFFEHENSSLAGAAGGRELVILLDQSYSMGYGDRWQRGVAAAHRAIEGMGSNDKATVVLFSDEARALTQATGDRAILATAIDTAKVSSRGTKYGPALKLARSILEQSRLPRHEMVLVTDFQKQGWNPDESMRMPPGTALTKVDLSSSPTPDVAVSGLSFQRDFPQGRERVLVSARIINKSGDPAKQVPVSIDLNGRELQSRTLDLPANSATPVTFAPFMLPEGTSRGDVRTGPDALPADNIFNFTLAQGQAVHVLIVEPAGGTDRSFYLRRAFGVGDHPAFRAEVKRVNQLTAADLTTASVVILDDAGIPTAETARLLDDYVNRGGGVIIATGEKSAAGSFATESRAFLPATSGNVVDRASMSGGKLTRIDYSHPVFELFRSPRSGDFSGARFFRYRRLELRTDGQTDRRTDGQTQGRTDAQTRGRSDAQTGARNSPADDQVGVGASVRPSVSVVASFDDGSPALVQGKHGKGTVLMWASTLDNYWSDLAVQAVFLPFVHQLAKHAGSYAEIAPWFTVGEAVDVSANDGADRTELVAVAPSGARSVLPAGTGPRVLTLNEQGFYEIRRPGATVPVRVVAANLDLAESDLTPLDPAVFAAGVEPRGVTPVGPDGATVQLAPEERERPQSLWWYLLVAAFVFLAAETVVGNQLSRGAAT
jgi:hypothetical protein